MNLDVTDSHSDYLGGIKKSIICGGKKEPKKNEAMLNKRLFEKKGTFSDRDRTNNRCLQSDGDSLYVIWQLLKQ